MDKTNYPLLAIVGAVALTAIIAMFVHAERTPTPGVSPVVTLTDGFANTESNGLTGNVIASDRVERPAVAAPERARPDIDLRAYDYNQDGDLTARDTDILVAVVARSRFCPEGLVCDVNSDGIVDDADRRTFDAAILRMESERAEAHEILVGTPSPAPAAEDEFWLAVTGASES